MLGQFSKVRNTNPHIIIVISHGLCYGGSINVRRCYDCGENEWSIGRGSKTFGGR